MHDEIYRTIANDKMKELRKIALEMSNASIVKKAKKKKVVKKIKKRPVLREGKVG